MDLLSTIVLIALLFFVAMVAAAVAVAVVLTRRGVRAGRRKVAAITTSAQARLPGPVQPVHACRAQVRRELTSAAGALHAARAAGRPVQPFVGSLHRLQSAAGQLELDLAIIAGEPDAHARAELFAGQAERLTVFTHACSQLRRGAMLAGGTWTDAALHRAARDLDDEIDRLRLRADAYRDLTPWTH